MEKKRTILIVEDEAINRKILAKSLSDEYTIVQAENGSEALTILKDSKKEIAAIILDLVMPIMNGYEFLAEYEKSEELQQIPVLVSTSDRDAENETRCLKLGACDFISKPYNINVVKLRLKSAIERSQLALLEQLRYAADFDALTGIYNRDKLYRDIAGFLAQNPEKKYVFMLFDIDNFKSYNSFFGVDEGDKLICYMSESVKKALRDVPEKLYSRCTADAFNIVMPYDETKINDIIAELIGSLNDYRQDYHIKPSFGVYIIIDSTMSGALMHDRAKLAAKNCKGQYMQYVNYYDERISERMRKEQVIINDMENALKTEQFVVYCQPKYSLQTGKPAGAEALVRWIHPEKGMISPGDFIPVFEKNGFVSKLDYYMWEHVCILLRKWIDEGKTVLPISVNVSRVNIFNPKLVEILCDLVHKYNVPVELFNLELTESAYMDNQGVMKNMMNALQKEGFIIMMDDFGSGYSSLNTLKDINVDVLKIDMKFMEKTDNPGRSENILASIVRMAKWLNMPVIAEGVEQREQVDFLKSIGCEYVQGYYFAKPMPVVEYEKLLDEEYVDQKYMGQASNHVKVSHAEAEDNWSVERIFSHTPQPCGVYECSKDYAELLKANDAYYDLFGFRVMESGHQDAFKMVDDKYRAEIHEKVWKAMEEHQTTRMEFPRNTENGGRIWIQSYVKFLQAVDEKYICVMTFIDITEQKRLEEELKEIKDAIFEEDVHIVKMLIADDAEVTRAALRAMFEDQYIILEAENGTQALKIIRDNDYHIDILMLDLFMPDMNGTEVIAELSKEPKMKDIPVVIMTAEASVKSQSELLELGASDYIVKPFAAEVVKKRVENVLEAEKHRKSREKK